MKGIQESQAWIRNQKANKFMIADALRIGFVLEGLLGAGKMLLGTLRNKCDQ